MTATRRASALTLLLLVLAPACARSSDVQPIATGGSYGSGVDLDLEKERKDAAEEGVSLTAPPQGGGGQPVAGQPVPPPPRPVQQQGNSGPYVVDFAGLGSGSAGILNAKNHKQLVVEINAAQGATPSSGAITTLKQRLSAVVDKPSGVRILPVKTFPAPKDEYTMDDVANLEKKYRKERSDPTGPKATLHVLYLNGQLDRGSLGVAYYSTSVVIMQEAIRGLGNPAVSAAAIETAALVHEVGHVLGLVNIGYKSPRDHEDPEHKGHSKNRGSVMYYAVDSLDVMTILNGAPPTNYDAHDLADLADRRAGKY